MTRVRGVAYFGSRLLRHVKQDMQAIVDLGFTDVLHTLSEDDLRHYERQMHAIVEASREVGLRVSLAPFGVAGLFGGESSSYLLAERPEVRQIDPSAGPVAAACPSNQATRDYLAGWARAGASMGAQRLFWDEPHWGFPASARRACVCHACLGRSWEDPGQRPQESLLGLLRDLTGLTRELELDPAICLLPHELGGSVLTDWREVARLPGLAELSTDPYWVTAGTSVQPFVSDCLRRLTAAVEGTSVTPAAWLQGFGLGPEDQADVETALDAFDASGITDHWVWGFEAAGHMTSLATREPEVVWRNLTRRFVSPVLR